jgi:hypothetical protein
MSAVMGFEVENKYQDGEIVWGRAKGNGAGPIDIGGGGIVPIMGTYIILWVKNANGEKVLPRNIKFPDLKIEWPTVDNTRKVFLIAKYKRFSKKIVLRLKNIKISNGRRPHPTTVNVQVGGD